MNEGFTISYVPLLSFNNENYILYNVYLTDINKQTLSQFPIGTNLKLVLLLI